MPNYLREELSKLDLSSEQKEEVYEFIVRFSVRLLSEFITEKLKSGV